MAKTFDHWRKPLSPAVIPTSDRPLPVEEDEILDWDYELEFTPDRPSGTIEVTLTKVDDVPAVEVD